MKNRIEIRFVSTCIKYNQSWQMQDFTSSTSTASTTCTSTTHSTCTTACTSAQAIQAVHVPQLNWSHFKPEFTGKPEEDAEAHLLRTNDWMDTHAFQEDVKVQHFCLTQIGEARLWYESSSPINIDRQY